MRRGGLPRLVLSISPFVQFEEVASAFSSMLLQLIRVLPSIKKDLVAAGAHRMLHTMIVDRVGT